MQKPIQQLTPVRNFDGGINTRINPYILVSNFYTKLVDCDIEATTLKSEKSNLLDGGTKPYFFYKEDEDKWLENDTPQTGVVYRNNLYTTDAKVLYKGNSDYLDLNVGKPELELGEDIVSDNLKWSYGISYIRIDNTVTPEETNESEIVWSEYSITKNKVILPYTLPDDVDRLHFYYREYDKGNDTTREKLIGNYTQEDLLKNRTFFDTKLFDEHTEVTDTVDNTDTGDKPSEPVYFEKTEDYTYRATFYYEDKDVEMQPSDSVIDYSKKNSKIRITSTIPNDWKVRLYRLGGDLIDYTLVTTLTDNNWYYDTASDLDLAGNHILDSFDNAPMPISLQYLTMSQAVLFGAKENYLYFSKQGHPEYFPDYYNLVFDEDITGIGVIQAGLLVFTKYKSYIVVGTNPNNLASYLISNEQGCLSHYTISYIQHQIFWLSNDGICTTDGGSIKVVTQERLGLLRLTNVTKAETFDQRYFLSCDEGTLVLDFRYGFAIYWLSQSYTWLGYYKDKLYGSIGNNRYILFEGNEELEFTYKSPKFTEGLVSAVKYFKTFRVALKGKFTIKLYVDNKLSNTYIYDTDKLTSFDNNIKITQGYSYQVEITGKGEVYEFFVK